MLRDSYLAYTMDHRIDIRYFTYDRAIEFYKIKTDGMPFFIENIGTGEIDIYISKERNTVKPGERINYFDLKKDIEKNTDPE